MTEPLLWWGLALFGAALLVLVLELFVPSGGLLALLCIALTVSGVVCFFQVSTMAGVAATAGTVVLAPLVAYFFLKIYPDTPMGRRLILGDPEGRAEADASGAALADAEAAGAALLGMTGRALTELRPVGTVELEGRRLEAASEVGLIHAGQMVRVTAVEGTKVRVRPVA